MNRTNHIGRPNETIETLTPAEPCPYLSDRLWRLSVVERRHYTPRDYANYLANGYRRSGDFLYQTACPTCQACIPCRICIDDVKLRRRHRRILKKNTELKIEVRTPFVDLKLVGLYEQYISLRHRDGAMYPPNINHFLAFAESSWATTRFLCGFLRGELVAVAVTDLAERCLSAVYTFFSPFLPERSLGVWAILQQIELARDFNAEHLYLGFWLRNCKKMAYKTNFPGCQLFDRQSGWLSVDKFLPND